MTSDNRCLAEAELDEVNGGMLGWYPAAGAFAYGAGCTFAANALMGGYVADAAKHAARMYQPQ
jgi:hypothetical protein